VLCRKPAVVALFTVVVVDDRNGAGRGRGRQENRDAEDGPTATAHPGEARPEGLGRLGRLRQRNR
jgi:hypothetical protein